MVKRMYDERKCPVCGRTLNSRNKTYCSRACSAAARQNYKVCVVCGKKFKDSAANDTRCCSPECSKKHREQLHASGVYDDVVKNLITVRDAYIQSHQGELHHGAKDWVLQSPDGEIYECRNLLHFIRTHQELFNGTVRQAYDGIQKIKASAQGKRKNPSYQWKGWRLIRWSD